MKGARKEKETSHPTNSAEDDAALESLQEAQAEDVEIIREIAGTQMTIREQLKQSLIDTGFDLDIGGVHIYDWKESGYAIPLVLLYNAVFLMSFFYFCYTLTLANQAEEYLSLKGTDMYQSCKYVPLLVTGSYEGDVYGNWETATNFKQNGSIFVIDMVGTQVTVDEYKSVMKRFQAQLDSLSDKSARRDAGWNAMAWATYQFYDDPSSITFYSSADISIIYDNDISMAALSSAKGGMCDNLYQYGSYEVATTRLSINVVNPNVPEKVLQGYQPVTMIQEACPTQFLAHQWLDNEKVVVPQQDIQGELRIEFDLNTAINAIALNMGINNISVYTIVSSAYGSAGAGGIPGTWVINPYNAPMDPIFCLDIGAYRKKYKITTITDSQVTGPPVCFLVQGPINEPIFYYPITASYYTLPLTGEFAHCTCPEDGTNPQCNGRDFVLAFFYDMNHTQAQITNSFKMPLALQKLFVDDPVNGDLKMQKYVTPVLASAYYIAPPFGMASMNKTFSSYTDKGVYYDYNFLSGTFDETHQTEWMNICPWGTCGAVIFETYKSITTNSFLPLNVFDYQAVQDPALSQTYTAEYESQTLELKQAMCMNNLYIEQAMNGFADTPPTQIVQPYQQCQATAVSALMKSVGNAAGVSNIVAAIFMFVVGFTFLRVYNHWATQTILKKVTDSNYLPGKDVKFMMPVNQKARIDAKLNQRRTQYLLDVLSGMAVKIRRLEDDMAAIPNKKKPAFDQIPPEEVDLADRLQRLQKFMTLDVSGAIAKSNAGLTKEALALMRFKREVSSAGGGSQKAASMGGSIARGKPGSAAAGAAAALKAKKSSFEVERASPEEEDEVTPPQQSVFGMPFLTNVFGPNAQVRGKDGEEEEDTSSV